MMKSMPGHMQDLIIIRKRQNNEKILLTNREAENIITPDKTFTEAW